MRCQSTRCCFRLSRISPHQIPAHTHTTCSTCATSATWPEPRSIDVLHERSLVASSGTLTFGMMLMCTIHHWKEGPPPIFNSQGDCMLPSTKLRTMLSHSPFKWAALLDSLIRPRGLALGTSGWQMPSLCHPPDKFNCTRLEVHVLASGNSRACSHVMHKLTFERCFEAFDSLQEVLYLL